jgi:putative tryptophan/tyrosine transport system substrate-binding protein
VQTVLLFIGACYSRSLLGYEEGQNLSVERYSAYGRTDTYGEFAARIVGTRPDLIFTVGSLVAKRFATATDTIPVVGVVSDPVATGLSASLSSPTANVTGVVADAGLEVTGKRLELLRELRPSIRRVALVAPQYVWDVQGGTASAAREVARQAGIHLTGAGPVGTVNEQEYRRAFAEIEGDRPDAILVFEGPENYTFRKLIVDLVNATRLPAIYPLRDFTDLGGLMAYAIDLVGLYKHAAGQIHRILQGHPVAEVPYSRASKFDLVINLKTAKEQGFEIPPALVARADEVIE